MAIHTVSSESFAMRLGQSLGRGVGGVLRAERAVWSAISRAGAPSIIVAPVKWLARAVVVVGGTVLAAWGLLYVLAVLAMVAIVVGLVSGGSSEDAGSSITSDEHESRLGGRKSVLDVIVSDDELPYGMHRNIFGQTKNWFQSEDEWR